MTAPLADQWAFSEYMVLNAANAVINPPPAHSAMISEATKNLSI